ncbi:hypothetical protein LPC_0614 [Legionella pneumophila str. Corby]|nr:hypothetical protein LPC_0614 [Legionella pneumophila str. Corby]
MVLDGVGGRDFPLQESLKYLWLVGGKSFACLPDLVY